MSDPYERHSIPEVTIDSSLESPEEASVRLGRVGTPGFGLVAMIDLHSHTNESDGTFSPAELIAEAVRMGVKTLGITDHDTFAGHDLAVAAAHDAGVELVRGIELSTKLHGQSVHLLGYFFKEDQLAEFRSWVIQMQASRRDRNVRLAARLRENWGSRSRRRS